MKLNFVCTVMLAVFTLPVLSTTLNATPAQYSVSANQQARIRDRSEISVSQSTSELLDQRSLQEHSQSETLHGEQYRQFEHFPQQAPRQLQRLKQFIQMHNNLDYQRWVLNRALNDRPTEELVNPRLTESDKTVYWTQMIAANPNDVGAYVSRGKAYMSIGRYQSALDDFTEALRLKPDSAESYYWRAMTWNMKMRYQEAISDLNSVIEIRPTFTHAYTDRCANYEKLGRYQEALADCHQALQLNPNDAQAYNNRGVINGVLGHHQDAIDDFNRALQLNPTLQPAQQNLQNLSQMLKAPAMENIQSFLD